MKVTFLGAAKQVSGSMTLLEIDGLKILVDCGLIQTNDTRKDMIENKKSFEFNPFDIDYCVITHAHIDHCGLIPYLVKSGYTGPIICTEPTMNICEISLKDCAYIWQKELEKSSGKTRSKIKLDLSCLPYTMDDAAYAMQSFRGYGYDSKIILNDNVTLILRKAGHILGAASLEFIITNKDSYKSKKIVFTGDFSGKDDFHPFIQPVEYFDNADYVICESTYGDKKHNKTPVIDTFVKTIKETCIQNNNGKGQTLLIASFSVQRLQEIIWYLHQVYQEHPEFNKVPIYIDTPMGKNVSRRVYAKAQEFYSEEAILACEKYGNILEWDNLIYIDDYKESMALANGEPKIIISSAGMMQAGRILNHIDSFLPSKGCTIMLTGFCAIGTFGRKLMDAISNKQKTIQTVSGKRLSIRANVIKLEGLSGHADKNSIIKYLSNIKGLKKIILNHGERESIETLKHELQQKLDVEILVPNRGNTITLK